MRCRRTPGGPALDGSCPAGSARAATISAFKVPGPDSRPFRIAPGPDGALWFTDDYSIEVGRVTTGGRFAQFSVRTSTIPAFPAEIVTGPDGALWFTETGANGSNTADRIGRITTGGAVSAYDVPTRLAEVSGIAAGPDGALWFAEREASKIGRITTEGAITEFPFPTASGGRAPLVFHPNAIVTGPDGALWFTQGAGPDAGVGRMTTTGALTRFTVPGGRSSQDIALGPDGALWFTEARGRIGRLTTGGALRTFTVSDTASPTGRIAAGRDGSLWFTRLFADKVGRITVDGTVSVYRLPPQSRPGDITAGPDGAMWFTEDSGRIARITAPPPPRVSLKVASGGACVGSSVRLKVRIRGGERLARAELLLDGRRLAVPDRRVFTLRIRARELRHQQGRLEAVAIDAASARVRAATTISRCARPG